MHPAALAAPAAPAIKIIEGEIQGAKYTIAHPSGSWNGRVLLHAHGYRVESAPLVADLFPAQHAYAELLKEGWIVATTSYRRNGLIIVDAIEDLDSLRSHIVKLYGEPSLVILEGESMGGAIVTLMTERGTGEYAGAVAIGAALEARETNGTGGVTLQPKVPLLFLSNQSELEGPKGYVQRVKEASVLNPSLVASVLFRVSRNGHVNINQSERLGTLRALIRWIEEGRETLPKPTPAASGNMGAVYGAPEFFDATVAPVPLPSQVEFAEDGQSFTATVTEVSAIYGNAFVNVQPADFVRLGLSPGGYFQLDAGEKRYRVRYGRDFSSVERGQWVAFPNADGFFWLARYYANAAETAELKVGTVVRFTRYPKSP